MTGETNHRERRKQEHVHASPTDKRARSNSQLAGRVQRRIQHSTAQRIEREHERNQPRKHAKHPVDPRAAERPKHSERNHRHNTQRHFKEQRKLTEQTCTNQQHQRNNLHGKHTTIRTTRKGGVR